MRKLNLKVFLAATTVLIAAPAQAQLTVNRVDACFQAVSGTSTSHQNSNGNTVAACASNAVVTYWDLQGPYNAGDDYFGFQRVSVGPLTFGADNLSNVFNLGWFYFVDANNTNSGGADKSTTLKFEFTFADYVGEWSYTGLTVNYDYRNSSPELFSLSGGEWSDWFTVNGEEYRFAIVGFDTPHPGSPANYCKTTDDIPTGWYSEASNGKLCGQFEKRSTVAEPATLSLVAAGFLGLMGVARRRRDA